MGFEFWSTYKQTSLKSNLSDITSYSMLLKQIYKCPVMIWESGTVLQRVVPLFIDFPETEPVFVSESASHLVRVILYFYPHAPCSGVLLGKARGNGLVWSGSYLWRARTFHFLHLHYFSTVKPYVRMILLLLPCKLSASAFAMLAPHTLVLL